MSPEIIGLVAIIGTTISGILTTLFHSRCSKIRCCGVECDREVMHTKDEVIETPLESFERKHNLNVNPEIKKILDSNINENLHITKIPTQEQTI
tara:strand:- start:1041 stop:1322 length:282 start_codon:yes stop_codon:yes gene_type:complete